MKTDEEWHWLNVSWLRTDEKLCGVGFEFGGGTLRGAGGGAHASEDGSRGEIKRRFRVRLASCNLKFYSAET